MRDETEIKSKLGGQFATWPLVPLWQTCRDRITITSEPMVESRIGSSLDELGDLHKDLKLNGMEPVADDLAEVMRTYEYVEASSVIKAVSQAYDEEYGAGTNSRGDEKCPYEETGNKGRCQACPVASNALGKLKRETKDERGRSQE